MKNLRVAIVHDWLTGMRGGEKCLEVLCEIFPDAPIFTLLHTKGSTSPLIESRKIFTSFINKFPFVDKKYRNFLPLFPKAIESFDFSNFDLIISTSHCVAKGIIKPKNAIHICYCHTPMRYVWDKFDDYFGKGKSNFMVRLAMKIFRPYLQNWDKKSSSRVDYFIANSQNVANKILKIYGRESVVITPPVDLELFKISDSIEKYFLIVSALVPYKKIEIAIECFNKNGLELLIVGSGPLENELKNKSNKNIKFIGWVHNLDLVEFYQNAIALIFPGEEDFGIVPLEAMACGKPVIAYEAGGALETVIENKTGLFFKNQNADFLQSAIDKLSKTKLNPQTIRKHALNFSKEKYAENMREFIFSKLKNFSI